MSPSPRRFFPAIVVLLVAPTTAFLDEAGMDTPQMIQFHGYPIEIHHVVSGDGYMIAVHRIPCVNHLCSEGTNKPPILLQHGLLQSSVEFVTMGPRYSLGYVLSDAGYDVWLSNARGNYYSRKHISMTANSSSFWDFSWHEMGKYDMPAVIDYVLLTTGKNDLFYIGHSMGSAIMLVMLHEKPDYNDKIRAMFGLGPAAYLEHMASSVSKLLFVSSVTGKKIFQEAGIHELFPRQPMWRQIGSTLCKDYTPTQNVCASFLSLIFGYNEENLNKSHLPVNLGHFPAGASLKTVTHFGQNIISGKFRHFNYGKKTNLLHYGSQTPPVYNLSRIRIPVNLYCGLADILCDCKDVERLYDELTNAHPKSLTRIPKYTHMDFLWGIDAHKIFYGMIIKKMKMFI